MRKCRNKSKLTFNSRPHAEVDEPLAGSDDMPGPFNSRPHAEVDSFFQTGHFYILTFQLTTSRRGRRLSVQDKRPISSFNSRPHAEVDISLYFLQSIIALSTHDLTQRSTNLVAHELKFKWPFNSRPHAEVDDRNLPTIMNWKIFQLTTSRRGRLRAKR